MMKKFWKYIAVLLLLVPLTLTAHITGQSHIDWTHTGLDVNGATTELSGFTLYCGNKPRTYTFSEAISDATQRSIDFATMSLVDGNWYCAMVAKNIYGTESAYSNEVLFPMAGGVILNPNDVPAPAAPSITLVVE